MPPQELAQTATDPKANPIAFIYENRKSLANMSEEKALKLIDVMFKRHMLPRYQQINRQGLSSEEVQGLRMSFFARMLDIPTERQVNVKGEKLESGMLRKGAAALEAGGAGVLGGIRSFSELVAKLDKTDLSKDPIHKAISKAEGKAYEDASAIDPKVASGAAAVGHQIPATLAAEGVGGVIPKVSKGVSTLAKVASGGARGAAEGTAFESARPGGDPASGAKWGGVLGAAFPMIGQILGLGRGTAAPTREAASTVGSSVGAATSTPAGVTPGNFKEMPDIVAQKYFGKSFKDLSPAERVQMPEKLKAEIGAQREARKEGKKAASEAMKAAKEADLEKRRGEKAKAAEAKATKQAETRATVPKATAQAAVAENPQAVKAGATFTPEVKPEPTVTKVPEGQRGKQTAGSPAKQAADRERIAKKREEASREQLNVSLEQHARELAGRYTPASLNMMHLPEMEEAVKELPGGKEILQASQRAKKTYKMSDEIYMHTLKEWMLEQFEKPNE